MHRIAWRTHFAAVIVLGAVLALAACGSSSNSGSLTAPSKASIKGQTITVLLPYNVPKALLAQFTAATGVKVNLEVAAFDAVHSKLIVANTASTYLADVTEVDWSFTGQFATAKWYQPLENVLGANLVKDLGNTEAPFKSGGHTYAACYSNDFRMTLYNQKLLAAAGVTQFPQTFTGLAAVIAKLKRHGIQYPLAVPMAATEGGVTPWYLLTLAMGGQLFDKNYHPLFGTPGSAGNKALQFEVDAIKNGWASPGSVTLDDTPSYDKFNAGRSAITLSNSPGNLPVSNDPKQSSISPNARGALVPGVDGPGASFGLPEGLGIPVTAQHKEAALAFIRWFGQTNTAVALYKAAGFLPCEASALDQLTTTHQLQGGDIIKQELTHVVSLFPNGAPKWYSQFSSDAQGAVNSAVKGEIGVPAALSRLAKQASVLAGGGS
ncbi:MAG: extracellular solute-binding protein [Actinomycetota bacterium]|nr:extracellular solute-binding protein [Actinomycetota bacterium]